MVMKTINVAINGFGRIGRAFFREAHKIPEINIVSLGHRCLQRILEDRHRQFWLLHSLGWLGFALVAFLGSLFQEMRDAYLLVVALDAYAGWLLTIPLRYLYQRIRSWHPAALIGTVLLASLLTAACWSVIKNFNYWGHLQKRVSHPPKLGLHFRLVL